MNTSLTESFYPIMKLIFLEKNGFLFQLEVVCICWKTLLILFRAGSMPDQTAEGNE